MKTTTSQKEVINTLIFTESYETLLAETGLKRGELRDDLIQLINAGMVEVYDEHQKTRLNGYDNDRLELFSFRATHKGLNARF